MARFETGPMNTKPTASDLLKTKQSKNKKFEAKKNPLNQAGFLLIILSKIFRRQVIQSKIQHPTTKNVSAA